ncbi:MAG: hypothetical protein K2K48_07715 [Anaeroplasmataceae bacterium]|nr:hypothetical protein [Anaeroplasmataceae bacterium]MDE6415289.1 hypothetical protein [Anaeroplasmataceae bacterium]
MKNIKEFIPSLLGLILSIIAFVVYVITTEKILPLTCVQIFVVPLLLFIIQGLNWTNKIRIPIVFQYLLCIHLVLALILGSGFDFYDKFSWWDLLLHGYFGFLFSFLVFIILFNYDGEKMKPILFLVIIFFITMGAAGLWEIYEFTMDRLLNGDAQRIQESIAQGHTPVYDTMMDLIIAISGILGFYAILFVDKCHNYRISKYIYKAIKKENKE